MVLYVLSLTIINIGNVPVRVLIGWMIIRSIGSQEAASAEDFQTPEQNVSNLKLFNITNSKRKFVSIVCYVYFISSKEISLLESFLLW